MKREITYSSLLDYAFDTINKAYKKHTTYPYIPMLINLKYLYDKYNISESQDKQLKKYLIKDLGCKETLTNVFSIPPAYINIDSNQIGIIDIRRNSDEIAAIINISYALHMQIKKNGGVPSGISIGGRISPDLIDELSDYGILIDKTKVSIVTDINIKNPEEVKFANYKGGKIMYREVSTVAEKEEVQVNMANIINTYDVLKVQQQNVRSTKLVKGLKGIQRSIPNEVFRETDVVLDIDPTVQSKINQVIMKYHMTMSKKYRVDNTYTIMCNCLTSNEDVISFKTAMVIHNPDNNIQPTWESYSKVRIGTTADEHKTDIITEEDNVANDDPADIIDDIIPEVEEMFATAEENDFDAIPSAEAMKAEADKVAKAIEEQRKEIANGLRFAAKHGEYSFSTNKVVYGCIIEEIKAKRYKVHLENGVTTFSCK